MIEWINSHGMETILTYLVFTALVGSMPPLPNDAGYFQKWIYAALHALAMNFRTALNIAKLPMPEGSDPATATAIAKDASPIESPPK